MTIPNMGHCVIQLLQSNILQEWININEKSEKTYNINNNDYMRYKDIETLYNLKNYTSILYIIHMSFYCITSLIIILSLIFLIWNKEIFNKNWTYSKIIDNIQNKI